ncbi:FtsQ-type POTRA domain-containing protein, partial [Klebsiella aerogenes]|uniref:FtsQ-type POTRA domain-containing protein n=2 Tax=Pseudomonadota TaxID=1224 RepID=UPI0013D6792D
LARVAGFGVERVTISGISRMYEREVLEAAGIDGRSSVPFLDVAEVRERLLRVPLIASASVRKLYPNEVVITQVEREPA